MSKKVLMVDDDPEMGTLVGAILKTEDYIVYNAYSGIEGLKKAYELHPDLIILDIMMPDMDGFTVCSRLREVVNTPILMLTAHPSEGSMLRGFTTGADDYLKKPFSYNELKARVRALLRRAESRAASEPSHITAYVDPVLDIDFSSKTVQLLGKIVELSPIEYSLMACLVRSQGKVMSHRELMREVWGDQYVSDSSMLSLYVYYLRRKIQDGKHGHKYIRTFWGRGYWFAPWKDEETP